jgi:hypothetical protein
LTGSPGFDRAARVNSDLKKNQNDIVLLKKNKKINELQPSFLSVLAGLAESPGHPTFDFLYFFSNPARFQSRIA